MHHSDISNSKKQAAINLSLRERDILLKNTMLGPALRDRLQLAHIENRIISVEFSLGELDELLGFIAAQDNDNDSISFQNELDDLYERLDDIQKSYIPVDDSQ
jgi:hypothetical protein